MTRTIRARVTRGNLAPFEPLDLPDGSEVDVTVTTVPSADDIARPGPQPAAGRARSTPRISSVQHLEPGRICSTGRSSSGSSTNGGGTIALRQDGERRLTYLLRARYRADRSTVQGIERSYRVAGSIRQSRSPVLESRLCHQRDGGRCRTEAAALSGHRALVFPSTIRTRRPSGRLLGSLRRRSPIRSGRRCQLTSPRTFTTTCTVGRRKTASEGCLC